MHVLLPLQVFDRLLPQWRAKLAGVLVLTAIFVAVVRKFDVMRLSFALLLVLPVFVVIVYVWFVLENLAMLSGMVFRNNQVVGKSVHVNV